jgi:hypothetical protein
MTPFQTFGAAAPPSNMTFPTAAYLQSSQNAAETRARGMEALGKGIAGGISSVASAYNEHKQEQAKFNATKKMVDVFGTSLNDAEKESIKNMFDDTSMSVKEKNALAPVLMQFLGASQQQAGREAVAKIMNQGRVDVAGARRPTPMSGGAFDGVKGINDYMDLPANASQGNPAPLQATQQQGSPMISADGSSVYDPRNGRWVRLDNNASTGEIVPDNYYDNPDNLMFDSTTRRVIR